MKPIVDTKARTRRIFAAATAIVGLTTLCVCLFRHTCMCGHLTHGPYSMLPFLNDAVWLFLLPMAAVASLRSDMYGKTLLAIALSYLVASNVQIITGRWAWHQWRGDLIHLSLLASLLIAAVGIFGGRQSANARRMLGSFVQVVSAGLCRIATWPPLIGFLATLWKIRDRFLGPLGWILLMLGFLTIACTTRYGDEGYFPIEREHHAAVTPGKIYTDGELHVALNGQSYDLTSHSDRRDTWTMLAAWLMLAGGGCLSQALSRREKRRSQQNPGA